MKKALLALALVAMVSGLALSQETPEPIPIPVEKVVDLVWNVADINGETLYLTEEVKDEEGKVVKIIEHYFQGDGVVGLCDLVCLAKAYGSKPGDENWDPRADITPDDVISLVDLVTIGYHYSKEKPAE